MIQKCSVIRVMEVFFKEPMQVHFIREISKKINLAPTSVRNNIRELVKNRLLLEKKAKPFDGFIANRENQEFKDYKQLFNLYSIRGLKEEISSKLGPRAIILFGSYLRGEDIESSDIDLLVVSKIKEINLKKFETILERRIHLTFVEGLEKLEKEMRENVKNGWVIYGRI